MTRWSFLEAVCLRWYLELPVLLVLFELFVQYDGETHFNSHTVQNVQPIWIVI